MYCVSWRLCALIVSLCVVSCSDEFTFVCVMWVSCSCLLCVVVCDLCCDLGFVLCVQHVFHMVVFCGISCVIDCFVMLRFVLSLECVLCV